MYERRKREVNEEEQLAQFEEDQYKSYSSDTPTLNAIIMEDVMARVDKETLRNTLGIMPSRAEDLMEPLSVEPYIRNKRAISDLMPSSLSLPSNTLSATNGLSLSDSLGILGMTSVVDSVLRSSLTNGLSSSVVDSGQGSSVCNGITSSVVVSGLSSLVSNRITSSVDASSSYYGSSSNDGSSYNGSFYGGSSSEESSYSNDYSYHYSDSSSDYFDWYWYSGLLDNYDYSWSSWSYDTDLYYKQQLSSRKDEWAEKMAKFEMIFKSYPL